MIRVLDILFSTIGLILSFPILIVMLVIGYIDFKRPLFIQERVGKEKRLFRLVKFRSMTIGTPSVGTHMMDRSDITAWGRFIRKVKLDELPQLWNVLHGDMSLVGPRPCLPNQEEVIDARSSFNIFCVRPGITGLAQLRKIDMSTPDLLAKVDSEMLKQFNKLTYLKYIWLTVIGGGRGDRTRS